MKDTAICTMVLAFGLGVVGAASGAEKRADDNEAQALPVVRVVSEYDPDDVRAVQVTTATKTRLAPRDVPQSIESLEVNKYKSYGINDLSILLDGIPGVNTTYDMRGEGVMIRGFSADSGDIYRDGIRESGQVRRSTANVERIEILKGPASVLYGRSQGGGIINMVSKQANFDAHSSVTLRAGSWDNYGGTIDINQVINPYVVMRLTADREKANSFRSGIGNDNEMISPSILLDNLEGLRWTGQYTYDKIDRVPDRGPAYDNLPSGVSIRHGFAHPDDYVIDRLRVWRSDLSYDLNEQWTLRWVAAKRTASQDFDHVFGGTYCTAEDKTPTGTACTWNGRVQQNYAWQQTENKTDTHTLDLTGKTTTWGIGHDLLVGIEYSEEVRHPQVYGTVAYPYPVDPFNPSWSNPKPERVPATQHNLHEVESQALYVQDLISLSPQWKILAGLRFDRYDFQSTNRLDGASRRYDDTTVSPRVGVVWQPTDEQSLYLSYSKSFAPYGGRGMISVSTSPTAVFDAEPQYMTQYEAGIKSEWLDGNLSTQLAVFELKRHNIRYQPDAVNFPDDWAVRGKDRSRGVEFSANGRLAEGWYVRGGVAAMAAEVLEDIVTPVNEGNYLANTAKRNGNLFLRYVPTENWYGEIGATYTAARYLNLANNSKLPGYTRWDALVGWRGAPWTVTAAVSNLFDTDYLRSASMPGAPRSFLLSANYQF